MSEPARPERTRESAEILTLAQAQYEAAGTIYGSSNPMEILDALINFTQTVYERADLGLVDDSTNPPSVTLLAEYKDRRVGTANRRVEVAQYPAFDTYSAIEVLNVTHVPTDPFLDDSERARLESEGTQALLIIPMVVTQRLIGVISLRSPYEVVLSPARMRALRNLVDQAAVVFENQSLLRNTAASLDEVRALYEVNRSMLATIDTMDVLRVLREQLANDAEAILHLVSAEQGGGYVLRHIVTRAAERDVQEAVTLGDDARIDAKNGTTVTFVEHAERAPSAQPGQWHPLQGLMTEWNAASYAVMNIVERGRVEDLIAIVFKQTMTFDGSTRRLYTAVADQTAIVLQNQRLLVEAQMNAAQANQQLRTLQVLNRFSIALSQITVEEELLEYAVKAMTESLGVDHGGLMLIDAYRMIGNVVAEYPLTGAVGQEVPLVASSMSQFMQSQAMVVADVETDDRIDAAQRRFLVDHAGIHGMIILPLNVQDQLIASIGLDIYERGRTLDPDTIQTATTMSAQIAVALQNIRLINDSTRRAAQLQRVAEFGQSVQASLQEDAIFDVMFAETLQMLPMDSLTIALYDEQRGALRVAAQRRSASDTQPIATTISLIGTLPGRAWEQAQTISVGDITNQKDLPPLPGSSHTTRSVLITPILALNQPVGLVIVTSVQAYAYTETDVAIFEQMVNQLSVALENSREFRRTQRTAQNEALVNTISAQLQRYTGLDEMMQVTLRELGRALGARRARARFAMTSSAPVSEEGG